MGVKSTLYVTRAEAIDFLSKHLEDFSDDTLSELMESAVEEFYQDNLTNFAVCNPENTDLKHYWRI